MKLPQGFKSASIAAGLKSTGALDLTLIHNQGPLFIGAAVFTSNKVVAAPVIWSRQVVEGGTVRAAVLNSGGANACTGPQGFADTHKTAEHVGHLLNVSAGEVIVCSTGLIGEFLPMEKILTGLDAIAPVLSSDGLQTSAQAIMTTDSVPKIATAAINGAEFAAIAKGAGMLAPALATMLSVVMTDVVVSHNAQEIFQRVTDRTYNRIDSDGCTSTNDTVLFMASGASGVNISDSDLEAILMKVCGSLADQLIADAEGSTKTVAIKVVNAATEKDAVEVGRACARNNLLKAAIFGGDPNWGRVLAAAGTADAHLDPLTIDVKLNGVQVCTNSAPDADKSTVNFAARLVEIEIDLKPPPPVTHLNSEQAQQHSQHQNYHSNSCSVNSSNSNHQPVLQSSPKPLAIRNRKISDSQNASVCGSGASNIVNGSAGNTSTTNSSSRLCKKTRSGLTNLSNSSTTTPTVNKTETAFARLNRKSFFQMKNNKHEGEQNVSFAYHESSSNPSIASHTNSSKNSSNNNVTTQNIESSSSGQNLDLVENIN